MEFEDLFTEDHGVARIVATLKSGHPSGLFGQTVNQFPFAFIAPLGAKNHGRGHTYPRLVATAGRL
jgi:hypothetical protein